MRDDSHRLVSWLRDIQERASHIYILGDLFDYWYTGVEPRVQDILKALESPRISVLTGNRDFLMKNITMHSIHFIPDEEHQIELFGKRILLAHGHTLTDNDRGFRILHRYGWPVLRVLDRRMPAGIKDRLARFLVKSSLSIRPPHAGINEDIAQIRGVETVICGHLHRAFMSTGLIVLPAFFDTGQWLAWDKNGPRLEGL
ncbi:MAG: metallophosphoesterase family protein [Deltaproteobacteria bacterium]|nr:metallophosphoesterase family protein [Deltaproteobacteria bacterium]